MPPQIAVPSLLMVWGVVIYMVNPFLATMSCVEKCFAKFKPNFKMDVYRVNINQGHNIKIRMV